MSLRTIAYEHNNELLIIIHAQAYFITCHAKYQSLSKFLLPSNYNIIYSLYIILFTSLTKTASYSTLIIRTLEISLLLSEGLLSRYTLLLSQLDCKAIPCSRSVGDL